MKLNWMTQSLLILLAFLLLATASVAHPSDVTVPTVLQIRLENEAITPVTARFVARSLRLETLSACSSALGMPGGLGHLVESMRDNLPGTAVARSQKKPAAGNYTRPWRFSRSSAVVPAIWGLSTKDGLPKRNATTSKFGRLFTVGSFEV